MPERVLSDQLCACGCGERTLIATQSQSGTARGEPLRYRNGHNPMPVFPRRTLRPEIRTVGEGPNPSGLCMCGCGETTPLAPYSSRRLGWVIDQPIKFVSPGHGARKPATWEINDEGCWIWTAGVSSTGYGQIRRDGRKTTAHRWVYEQRVGHIGPGLHLHHTCGVKLCVNPDHLEPMDPSEHQRLHKVGAHA